MKRVLVFGTFDGIHAGHRFLFQKALEFGDKLFVVVALDETVRRVKGRMPCWSQTERLDLVQKEPCVFKALLGYPGDKYRVIEEIQPHVICLGYDQKTFVDGLPEALEIRNISVRIVRLDAFYPEQFKSSILFAKRKSVA
ncbi:MAG: hypothetical protein A3B74_00150 [Candidatus Kerfeldbacteria bacterium RIFCSPHIGHO2_02_FULL_42_14]|uniref:Cytidyltransferase-like domain-containing protein n=1 Tax=Candidatus Kerfeldbacteria bacterium RIFCSPHIGHO2_02_FULL_42_14 TaxID=1798540 RepID=A0A1G2AQT7_9BACT|nr:MAG: hypothetical protein A3B74_00150 [Candidatus Kerfeldbacteria bacterium RIFCSPHIGHO2_02_FULL_42_14]OGY81312.1 MAG: hypothetical protein A3E60_02590 [Candidatus Kerfeldbacteria bacterium RIFCSPHIGHO2_12_FULL_42_13]OGY83586.1 MAG: hypothetical protein A3I91_03020 [Candidatus Kerfeldbacteria bacterium RIFCSPLOWO2_02_FULL_42_19]OGY86700.1 MAG: hypothetical protein A3G01_00605 [Candidatus Kerfeldbacteria bacterium RIFCSPLOWO2_12_FULL_43_9]